MQFSLRQFLGGIFLFRVFIISADAAPPTYTEPGGLARTCYAAHERTGEIVAVIGIKDYANGYYGFSTYNDAGWPVIILDADRLSRQPQIISRFTYYHECAHLSAPTPDEVMANCIALKTMRQNGDLSQDEEGVIANFVTSFDKLQDEYLGNGKNYWAATLKCADAIKPEATESKVE